MDLMDLAQGAHAAGMTVSVPRLPGHATHPDDFSRSRAEDWLNHAADAFRELQASCETVAVAGLSMGGLIASILASTFPVSRLALFAAAFSVRKVPIGLGRILGPVIPRVRSRVFTPRPEGDVRKIFYDSYAEWLFVKQVGELSRIRRLAWRALPSVHAPVLAWFSHDDEVVPPSAAGALKQLPPETQQTTKMLRGVGHVITVYESRELVTRETVAFLRGDVAP